MHSITSSWNEAANWNLDAFFPTRCSRFHTDVMVRPVGSWCPRCERVSPAAEVDGEDSTCFPDSSSPHRGPTLFHSPLTEHAPLGRAAAVKLPGTHTHSTEDFQNKTLTHESAFTSEAFEQNAFIKQHNENQSFLHKPKGWI